MLRQTHHVCLLLDSSGLGGIETHVLQLSLALQKRGHQVRVVFLKHYGEHPLHNQLEENNISYCFINGSILKLIKHFRSHHYTVVHTHGYKAGILGRLAAKWCRRYTVSTYHAGEPGSGLVAFYCYLDRLTAPLAHHIIAVSASQQANLPKKTEVIANFVPMPSTHNVSIRRRHVAFVGRLSHEKGPDLFAEVAKHKHDLDFHLYGDGPLYASMQHSLDKVQSNLTLHGRSNMNNHWQDIDLLMITSRHEALPLVALEAMSRGILVIAANVGGLPKLVVDDVTGWICEPTDTDALCQCLSAWQSLAPEVLKRMQLNCQALIREHYSVEAILPKIEAIYNRSK